MRAFKSIITFIIIVLSCVFMGPAYSLEDAILAVVNDEAITVSDLRDYLKSVYTQLRIEGKTQEEVQEVMTQYEKKGIEQLIDDKLILFSATQSGLMLKPKAVDDRLEAIIRKYPSREHFLDAISNEGITVTDVRKKLENQLKGQFMVDNEVRQRISVNPQEVTDYFNSHADEYAVKPRFYLDSIFVSNAGGKDESRVKINQALSEIKAGAEFKSVSAKYGDLPSVGEVNQEDIRPELRNKIMAVPDGGITDVIEVDNGFYIFKVGGRIAGRTALLKDVKEEIYQQLYEEKFRKRFKDWLLVLRKKAYVEIKN